MPPTTEQTEKQSLTKRIKDRALAEGFDKVGVVRAEALQPEEKLLREWLDRGYHGEMQWLAREPEKRADPNKLFSPARSVVVAALNYYTPHQHSNEPQTGKVSRYAWGDDYHNVVGDKLRALLDWIQLETPAVEGKVCVDIQPMMDKVWAVRAGLGWIGKHTNVITPEHGSWVFIGELLLNLDLDYDSDRVADHCGSCTLCIDACPTGAITEPYVVDSRRCISYATIELRDAEIPAEISGKLENWFYGCDICQDVCPWNRFEQPTEELAFEPRTGNVSPALGDIMNLTPETYAERFRNSAMKRAKLSGLKRNARALLETEP
jgi:epoxyqueuosine reductase